MADIHEPTIERVRRDVEQYKCQAAWLDTWALLRMFDEVRAELADARRELRNLHDAAVAYSLGDIDGHDQLIATDRAASWLDGRPAVSGVLAPPANLPPCGCKNRCHHDEDPAEARNPQRACRRKEEPL